jgi:hypothetical protein
MSKCSRKGCKKSGGFRDGGHRYCYSHSPRDATPVYRRCTYSGCLTISSYRGPEGEYYCAEHRLSDCMPLNQCAYPDCWVRSSYRLTRNGVAKRYCASHWYELAEQGDSDGEGGILVEVDKPEVKRSGPKLCKRPGCGPGHHIAGKGWNQCQPLLPGGGLCDREGCASVGNKWSGDRLYCRQHAPEKPVVV